MQFSADLEQMNLAQLRELAGQVEQQIVKTERRALDAAADQILRIAHDLGMPLQSLLDRTGVLQKKPTQERKKRAESTKLYAHPTDRSLTWGGYGPHPRWIKELTREGGGYTLEQLRVSD